MVVQQQSSGTNGILLTCKSCTKDAVVKGFCRSCYGKDWYLRTNQAEKRKQREQAKIKMLLDEFIMKVKQASEVKIPGDSEVVSNPEQ